MAPGPNIAHLECSINEMEQKQVAAVDELKDMLDSKVSTHDFNAWNKSFMEQAASFMQDGLNEMQLDIGRKFDEIKVEMQRLASLASTTSLACPNLGGGEVTLLVLVRPLFCFWWCHSFFW